MSDSLARLRAEARPEGGGTRRDGLVVLAGLIAVMWGLEIVDAFPGVDLDEHGIRPRETGGLDGVVAAPLLHAGFGHLVSNTIPLAIMGGAIALSGVRRLLTVTVIVALVSGLGTWLVADSNSNHIGASGVVFGFAAYLIVRGVFNRSVVQLGVGAVVVVLWGASLLGGILLPGSGVSWEAHLFGALGGVLAARLERAKASARSS